MAAAPPAPVRRRPRPGSLERPVSGRLYRGTWLLVALPLLLVAFTVGKPSALAPPALPPAFDRTAALQLAQDLARDHPNRVPGTDGATGAASWFVSQLTPYGLDVQREPFEATIPGRGRVHLENLLAVVVGRSPRAIVVMAHRDTAGVGQGANDNASGTAALIELARAYANPQAFGAAPGATRVRPTHTLVFLSTDGGAWGGLGAAEFASRSPHRADVVAVLNLDAIAGPAAPRLQFAGDEPRSPTPSLLATVAARLAQESGRTATRPSALRQLIDLGFPFSLYEQAPFVARGVPAVTVTTAPDRPSDSLADTAARLNALRLMEVGRAAQDVLDTLDQGLELTQGTSSYVFLGARVVRGWAIELALVAMLLPFLAAAVDLFARCRRRRIALAPAFRSLRSRLGFWAWVGVVFALFAVTGAWPGGASRPPAPWSAGAGRWPAAALVGFGVLMLAGWLVARDRLLPRRPVTAEEELAAQTASLLALGVVALVVVGVNAFALVFVLPSLHAWLWLPQVRRSPPWTRAAVLGAGLLGPALLLWSFGDRFGLGFDAPWYAAELVALGYAPAPLAVAFLAWLAGGAQLAAVAAGRYAPYPEAHERPRLGPLRRAIRRVVLGVREQRRASEERRRAFYG